jgi:two-component system LytT family response regulator
VQTVRNQVFQDFHKILILKSFITCIIVDGYEPAVLRLQEHIRMFPALRLKSSYADPREALQGYERDQPDIIFLEVHLPHLSGIDFITTLKEKTKDQLPKLVFVSDCDKYALSGYDLGVIDYLIKPVSFSRFKLCMDRLFPPLVKGGLTGEAEFFFVELDGRKMKIVYKDISLVEAAGNYVIVSTLSGNITLYKTMNSMQQVLHEDRFIRVHKSFIISINSIREISGNEIILHHQNKLRRIPIGATYKENLLNRLIII